MKKTIAITALLLGTTIGGTAQTNSQSPYSIYGIGDEPLSYTSAYTAMGHTSIGLADPVAINQVNPASFARITRPVFNFDLRSETLILNNTNSTQSNTLVSINDLSFAFPVIVRPDRKRNAGISFGLLPRTQSGYQVRTTGAVEDLGTATYQFDGDGGLNDVYLGFAYDLVSDSGQVNTLTLGVRGQYVFGTIERNRYTLLPSSAQASNVARLTELEVSDADFQVGLMYIRKLFLNNPDRQGVLSIGAYLRPSTSLSGAQREEVFTFTGEASNLSPIDTMRSENKQLNLVAPTAFGVGAGFNLDNRWTFGLDFSTTRWSELEIDETNEGLNNASRISLGTEFVPDYTAYKRFFEVMRYRAGLSFQQTRLNINNSQPLRYGINLGLGIPLFASRSTSMFNIAFEYATRTGNNLQVTESYFNLQFGVSITPNVYDKWFNKRKYD